MRKVALSKLGISGIQSLQPPLVKLSLYHYLHKKHEKLVAQVTKVFREMEEAGKIQQILAETEAELLQAQHALTAGLLPPSYDDAVTFQCEKR